MRVKANGIMLEYQEFGPSDGPALFLIRGLGTQLIHWPDAFVEGLAQQGFHTVIFDNRDIGLSQRCPASGVSGDRAEILAGVARGITPQAAYGIDDMARDVTGLMDVLGIARAHIFGISMGGMIAQTLATDHHDRLLSATFVMTAAGLGGRDILADILVSDETRDDFIESCVLGNQAWGSPGFPRPVSDIRAEAALAWERGSQADGINRQALAILNSPDRFDALSRVDLPCLVLHGANDTLIPPVAGQQIAALVKNAELHVIDGMGHVITPALAPLIVDLFTDFTKRRT